MCPSDVYVASCYDECRAAQLCKLLSNVHVQIKMLSQSFVNVHAKLICWSCI